MTRMNGILFGLTCFVAASVSAGEVKLGGIAPAGAVKGVNQFVPDAAYGGGKYLVVWRRSHNETARIECARVDTSGKVIDPKPVEIAPDGKWQLAPRVAFGGGLFIVTWYELRNGKDWDVYAARVSPDGKVLDPGGVLVSRTPDAAQILPAAVFDGRGFIVAWSELPVRKELTFKADWNYRLAAARVGLDGRPSAPRLLDIDYGGHNTMGGLKDWRGGVRNDAVGVDLAVAGDRLLIVAGGFTYANIFSLDLKPVGPKKGLVNPGSVRRPTVATDGKGFIFSCWTGMSRDARLNDFVRVSREGKLLDVANFKNFRSPAKEELHAVLGGRVRNIMGPALAFDGKNYLLVWQAWGSYRGRGPRRVATHLYARRVAPDGTSPDPASVYNAKTRDFSNDIVVAGTGPDQPNCMPRLASDGKGHVLMVWEQHPTKPDGNVTAATRMITTR